MNTPIPTYFSRRIVIPLAAALTVLPALFVRLTAQSTPEPVRLVCHGELLAIYGPQESGRGLKPLVVL